MNQLLLIGLCILILIVATQKRESFRISQNDYIADHHVNYPLDSEPEHPLGRKDQGFLDKLPYRNLTTRHYKQIYQSKSHPKCALAGTCDSTPGYYQTYPDYFENPRSRLKNFYLGYSVTGYPYNDYTFPGSSDQVDVREPEQKYDYPTWYDYQNPRKEAKFYGYPFYFGAKTMN